MCDSEMEKDEEPEEVKEDDEGKGRLDERKLLVQC